MSDTYSKFVDVGLMFEKRRIEVGMSIEDIANTLKITPDILIKIEAGNVESLLGKLYYEGIVIKYSNLVGLKSNKILHYISDDIKTLTKKNEQRIMLLSQKSKAKKDTFSMKIIFTLIFICFVIIAINTFIRKKQAIVDASEYLQGVDKYLK